MLRILEKGEETVMVCDKIKLFFNQIKFILNLLRGQQFLIYSTNLRIVYKELVFLVMIELVLNLLLTSWINIFYIVTGILVLDRLGK